MHLILLLVAMPFITSAAPVAGVTSAGTPGGLINWLFPHFERRTIYRRSISDDVGLDNGSPVIWKRDFSDFGLGLDSDSADSSPTGLEGQLFKRSGGGGGGLGGDLVSVDGSEGGISGNAQAENKNDEDKDKDETADEEHGDGQLADDPKGEDPKDTECEESEEKNGASDGSEGSEGAQGTQGTQGADGIESTGGNSDNGDNKAHCLGNVVKSDPPNSFK